MMTLEPPNFFEPFLKSPEVMWFLVSFIFVLGVVFFFTYRGDE